jgi:hypothetical protein
MDRREMVQELRVTEIFHREAGRWRIVHRKRRNRRTGETRSGTCGALARIDARWSVAPPLDSCSLPRWAAC